MTALPPRLVLGELLRDLTRFGERPAVVTDDDTITYARLVSDANRLANALEGLGIQPGERLAFMLPNGYRILCCYAACATSGIVGVPVGTRSKAREVAYQLADSGAVALVYDPAHAGLIEEVRGDLAHVRHFICDGPSDRALSCEGLLEGAGDDHPAHAPRAEDPFCIMYTGGTTGTSKAAVQTQRAWAACLLDSVDQLGYRADDHHAVVLPMTHAAWFTLGAHLLVGARTHILRRWDAHAYLELVEREQLTTLHLIPTLLGDLLAEARTATADLTSARLLTLAGSPVPLEMYERGRSLFGDIIGNIYGLTEAAGPVTFLRPSEMDATRIRSGGRLGRYVELTILDQEDETGDGLGEICLRGPQITPGYHNRPDENARAFRDGWFCTGDIGYLDGDGFLFIVDRKKDMIKSGGFNVYPKEVEEVLYEHPAVREASVFGIPDARWIEAVIAAVVVDPSNETDAGSLMTHCRERLSAYKLPKAIHVERALPRTAFGKFDKKALQRRYAPAGGMNDLLSR